MHYLTYRKNITTDSGKWWKTDLRQGELDEDAFNMEVNSQNSNIQKEKEKCYFKMLFVCVSVV